MKHCAASIIIRFLKRVVARNKAHDYIQQMLRDSAANPLCYYLPNGSTTNIRQTYELLNHSSPSGLTKYQEYLIVRAYKRMKKTRVYYRNPFMHIGHLNTLYYNDNMAKQHQGICYALVDDRPDAGRIASLQEDFEYLGLKHLQVVSVSEYREDIMKYTEHLVSLGYIYIHQCNNIETDPKAIMHNIKHPKTHFQLKLKCGDRPNPYKGDSSIGYTKEYANGLSVMLIFDYIIKVLDTKLEVTDIISTCTADVSDVRDPNISTFFDSLEKRTGRITYHRLDTYFIHGFKYAKKNWPRMNERDPSLLTIKGLKARHIPPAVLYAFYIHAAQMGSIKITYLNILLKTYLYRTSDRAQGVIKPLKVKINNWTDRRTEYICKPANQLKNTDMSLSPLSDTFYIESADYGMDSQKWSKGRYCRLKYGPAVKCVDVNIDESGTIGLHAEIVESKERLRNMYWVSSTWSGRPVKVLFYLYNWFYTGQNHIVEPRMSEGYIDNCVFNDLSKIYQIERSGYYIYDNDLSMQTGKPCFICICKIKP